MKLGYEVPTILRTLDEIKTTITNNPFTLLKEGETRKLYVTFLSDAPPVTLHGALDTYKNETEELKVVERELFILTTGIGNSKLTLNLIEKKLGVAATTRNWATVNKVMEL